MEHVPMSYVGPTNTTLAPIVRENLHISICFRIVLYEKT